MSGVKLVFALSYTNHLASGKDSLNAIKAACQAVEGLQKGYPIKAALSSNENRTLNWFLENDNQYEENALNEIVNWTRKHGG